MFINSFILDVGSASVPKAGTTPANPVGTGKKPPGTAGKRPGTSPHMSKVQTLFDHLPHSLNSKELFELDHPGINPIFFTLGLKYSGGLILGSNQRCIALLTALQQYIESFVTPEGKEFRHYFAEHLKPNLLYLKKCRTFAVAMENAIEFFNSTCQAMSLTEYSEEQMKASWIESLKDYKVGINKAKEAIVENAMDKIKSGDTVLVYGYSEVVRDILLSVASSTNPKKFDLIIVSDRPLVQEKHGKGLELLSLFSKSFCFLSEFKNEGPPCGLVPLASNFYFLPRLPFHVSWN